MGRFSYFLLPLLVTACEVDIGPQLLEGDLLRELREPGNVTALCGDALKSSASILKLRVEAIQAKRPFFGAEGHGSAQVIYPQPGGPDCKAKVDYDFSQDSKTFRDHGRVVGDSNKFFFGNLKITRN